MKLIKHLHNLSSTECILALENTKNKRVLLIRSRDALASLARVIKLIKSRNKKYRLLRKDYRKIDIRVLETSSDRLRYQYWVDQYRSMGSSFYREYKAVQYTPKIIPNEEYLLEVYLVSKGQSVVLVGVFDSLDKAQEFINRSYPEGQPIYSIIKHESVESKK